MTFEELKQDKYYVQFIEMLERENYPKAKYCEKLFEEICELFEEVIPTQYEITWNKICVRDSGFYFDISFYEILANYDKINFIPLLCALKKNKLKWDLLTEIAYYPNLLEDTHLLQFVAILDDDIAIRFRMALDTLNNLYVDRCNEKEYVIYKIWFKSGGRHIDFRFDFDVVSIERDLEWFDFAFDYIRQMIFKERLK